VRGPLTGGVIKQFNAGFFNEVDENGDVAQFEAVITETAGITKVYEAVTQYCGFSSIEAGKTMGLFPYGKENPNIPKLFDDSSVIPLSNRNLIIPNYPNGAFVNFMLFDELAEGQASDLSKLDNRRDLAYACQTQTQEQVLNLIRKASKLTGHNKVVISGGYGLNCVANYFYLDGLKDDGIEIYVEPVSNDAGTAMGAALLMYRNITGSVEKQTFTDNLYLGPRYTYTEEEINSVVKDFDLEIKDASYKDIIDLIVNKNIVSMFQGRSENGPRALGNRSILFDPRRVDGKDFVNSVKRREYFRPFAGSILKEYAHEWFDLRGKDESPSMMYAVNCQPGVEEKIPSIIHVDGTCRIQTVTSEQNLHFYNLISEFNNQTGCPILFNTSFNLGGDPLVETLHDAAETIHRSEINFLFLPEYGKLIFKKQ